MHCTDIGIGEEWYGIASGRVRATGRHYRQMRRKNIFGTKKHYLAKTSSEKKFSSKKIGT